MSEFESHEVEIEVDLAAFLPEGTAFDAGVDDADGPDADGPDADGPAPEPVADRTTPEPEPEPEPSVVADAAPSVDLEALDQLERDLDAVDAAIAALDAGTYGLDPASGAPIDDARLAQDPTRLS